MATCPIVEDAVVAEAIAAYRQTYSRVDDLWAAVHWRLSRQPDMGTSVGADTWLLKTPELADPRIPVLSIYYRFDGTQVHLIAVRLEDPGEY